MLLQLLLRQAPCVEKIIGTFHKKKKIKHRHFGKENQTKYECSPNVATLQTCLTYYCWTLGSNNFSNMMIISETRVSNSIVPSGGNSFNLIFNFLAHFRALIFPSIYKFLLSPRPYFMWGFYSIFLIDICPKREGGLKLLS